MITIESNLLNCRKHFYLTYKQLNGLSLELKQIEMKYLPFFLVLVAVVASSDVERSIQLRKQALLRDIILNPEA